MSWRRRKSRPQWHLKSRDTGLGAWMVLQASLHARRSSARLYQSLSTLMWRSSRSITMLSRQRLRGPWRGRVFWSSPNNTHFGILSSDMRPTCPNQRRRRVLSISTTDRKPARSKMTALERCSFHCSDLLTSRINRAQRLWNTDRRRVSVALTAHDSQP